MATLIVTTRSGSIYEIDGETNCIRRLAGRGDPTGYIGKDGDWRRYESLGFLKEGKPLIIRWVRSELPEGSDVLGHKTPGTITSPITDIR